MCVLGGWEKKTRERERERVYLLALCTSDEGHVTLLQLLFDHIV